MSATEVWVLFLGCYSERRCAGVFSSREAALTCGRYLNSGRDVDDVERHVVDSVELMGADDVIRGLHGDDGK